MFKIFGFAVLALGLSLASLTFAAAATAPAGTLPACCGEACKKMGPACCKVDDASKIICSMGGSCCVKTDTPKTDTPKTNATKPGGGMCCMPGMDMGK